MSLLVLAALALSCAGSWLAAPYGRSRTIVVLGQLGQGLVIAVVAVGLLAAPFESRAVTGYAWPLAAAVVVAAIAGGVRLLRRAAPIDAPAGGYVLASTPTHSAGRGAASAEPEQLAIRSAASPPADGAALYGLLAVLVALTVLASFEAHDRPPFPWDAWTTWLFRPKAAFLLPGVAFSQTPGIGSDVLALEVWAAHYPNFVGAALTWLARLGGAWNESHLLLLWPFAYLAATLAMLALADHLLPRRALAIGVTLLFATTPFLVTHAMLAGYMDLWTVGAVVLLSGAVARRAAGARVDAAIGAAFALPLLLKIEGVVWVAIALATVGLVRRPKLAGGALAALALLVLVCMFALPHGLHLFGDALVISRDEVQLPYLGATPIAANPVLLPLARAMFGTETFGVTSWAIVTGIVLLPLLRRAAVAPVERALRLYAGLSFLFVIALFGLTYAGQWAVDQTAVSRVLLQMLPALVLVAAPTLERVLGGRDGAA